MSTSKIYQPKADQLLAKAELRRTDARRSVLELFLSKNYALSHAEIEKELEVYCDRVTIYRILATFEEHGILHKIVGSDSVAQYALCDDHTCDTHHHHDQHMHFQCVSCQKIYCLTMTAIPEQTLSSGFRLQKLTVNAEGLCENC